jgi:7-cyano-7-deazaguanine synthase
VRCGLLLSGGMDSLAIAWWKRPHVAFTVDYGQRAARAEIEASAAICRRLGIEHVVLTIDCSSLGSGDMLQAKADPTAPSSEWWPYRNQMLITLVAMKAISMGIQALWIGSVMGDGGHRDGTPQFVQLVHDLVSYQEGGIAIEAPAIGMSASELIRVSGIPADALAWAHSCHKANVPCLDCRGCNKYRQTYQELGDGLDRAG